MQINLKKKTIILYFELYIILFSILREFRSVWES